MKIVVEMINVTSKRASLLIGGLALLLLLLLLQVRKAACVALKELWGDKSQR